MKKKNNDQDNDRLVEVSAEELAELSKKHNGLIPIGGVIFSSSEKMSEE